MSQVHSDPHAPHASGHDAAHEHPPFLAHHYETPAQQFGGAKMGMWVFLATEILMFGGLFVAYAVWRANHPEVFEYAHTHLNKFFGAINTVFLIASSFTMAWAVRCSQLGKTKATVVLISLTLLGGCAFLVVKTIEYSDKWNHHLFIGSLNQYHPETTYEPKHESASAHPATDHAATDPAATDHAATDSAATDPATHAAADHGSVTQAPVSPAPALSEPAAAAPRAEHTLIAPPHAAPAGITTTWAASPLAVTHAAGHGLAHGAHAAQAAHGSHGSMTDIVPETDRRKVHQFFQIYFLMTGLHTLHVLIGMGLLIWVLTRAVKGVFGPAYYTPVDIGGLYWHLVDLIWIFLFPLLYLIH